MAQTAGQPMTMDAIKYLVHHVVLPPRLPQESDLNASHEQSLIHVVTCALQDLREGVEDCYVQDVISSAITTISNLNNSRDDQGDVSELQLQKILHKLAFATSDETLPLELKAHNAGLLVQRRGSVMNFEAFELSPINRAAMSSSGRLIRTFPGTCLELPLPIMQQESFRKSIAFTLAKLSTQLVPDCQPQVQKNGWSMDEDRDTTDPTMVCEWLIHFVAALGAMTGVLCISKNTREEVLWNNCRHPWQRVPTWLLIRATLQLHFTRAEMSGQRLDGLYKVFGIQVLSRILQLTTIDFKAHKSETAYFLIAKMERRLRKSEKLGHLQYLRPNFIINLRSRMVNAHSSMNGLWQIHARNETGDLDTSSLRSMRPEDDLDLQLNGVDTFIDGLSSRERTTTTSEFKPVAVYPTYPSCALPTTIEATGDHKYFRVAAFESWIEDHLDPWINAHLHDGEASTVIYNSMKTYHSRASETYTGIPTGLSVMRLSLLELWVGSDRCACTMHPLLRQYDPLLELDDLQGLVLPFKSQFKRLLEVERYVRGRRSAATEGNPSVLEKFGHASSFAVKFFDQCPKLQATLKDIEKQAQQARKEKFKELDELKTRYKYLIDHHKSSACETEQVVVNRYHNYTKTQHSDSCARCRSKNEADNMVIHIYEWPLSADPATAKATVFECQAPQALFDWRDSLMFVIMDVLRYADQDPRTPHVKYDLGRHSGLNHILSSKHQTRRIIALSDVKSHTNTHRKTKQMCLRVRENDVCLANALRYKYFDSSTSTYTGKCVSTQDTVKKCMYLMPDSRSQSLRRLLYRPPSNPDGITSNQILANLADCPPHFSVEEYKGFAHVSVGRFLVYSNILAQLAAPTIDLAKPETQTLMLQMVEQCGASNGTLSRVTHGVLQDESLCQALPEQAEKSLENVTGNWDSWRAVATLVVLCRRVLSISASNHVRDRCLAFFAMTRRVTMEWLVRLKEGAYNSTEDRQRTELYSISPEIALLCCQTLDLEDLHLQGALAQTSVLSMLLYSSIVIQENSSRVRTECFHIHKAMLHSWRLLLHRSFHRIREYILQGDRSLHEAVLDHWADFRPAEHAVWGILGEQHEHWLTIQSGSLSVYFNLLTAKLLVDGLPTSRLPQLFLQHSMYRQLFGTFALEVIPTDYFGMRCSAKAPFRGYTLHFGMKGQDRLLVAIKDDSVFELMPFSIFKDCIPQAFVSEYVHWYNEKEDKVLFCSLENPSLFESAEWRLGRCESSWRLLNRTNTLISNQRNTARALRDAFRSLEEGEHIHIMLEASTRSLLVKLPRLQLDFALEHEDEYIRSRQYRGMVIDPVQSIGALAGLTSKLVLKPSNKIEHRLLLIPMPRHYNSDTIIHSNLSKTHLVSESICKDQGHKVLAFSLDTTLGRILDNGDLQGRLFLALLHALTSHCLPDPLTGYTGTESALSLLRSAAVRSFEYLTEDNMGLIQMIAKLAPARTFCPTNLMDMQQIEWDNSLPALSQCASLRSAAEAIIEQAQTMRLFYPDCKSDAQRWKPSNHHLEQRDLNRSSLFRTESTGPEIHPSRKDTVYTPRVTATVSLRGKDAYRATAMIARTGDALYTKVPDIQRKLEDLHFKTHLVQGPNTSFDPSVLKFDAEWLGNQNELVAKYWCNLHCALSSNSNALSEYDVMAWLSTMAFAKKSDMDVVQCLGMFYRSRDVALVKPPSAPSFVGSPLPVLTWYSLDRQRQPKLDLIVISKSTVFICSCATFALYASPA